MKEISSLPSGAHSVAEQTDTIKLQDRVQPSICMDEGKQSTLGAWKKVPEPMCGV